MSNSEWTVHAAWRQSKPHVQVKNTRWSDLAQSLAITRKWRLYLLLPSLFSASICLSSHSFIILPFFFLPDSAVMLLSDWIMQQASAPEFMTQDFRTEKKMEEFEPNCSTLAAAAIRTGFQRTATMLQCVYVNQETKNRSTFLVLRGRLDFCSLRLLSSFSINDWCQQNTVMQHNEANLSC